MNNRPLSKLAVHEGSSTVSTKQFADAVEKKRSIEAVFISDLHLHPDMPAITARFEAFIEWAASRVKKLYILGDFLHAWAGDDSRDEWSDGVADRLAWLIEQGVSVYFMPGNRDFLIGKQFITRARIQQLVEPALIYLDQKPVLLVHGDRYCTYDRAHQWLRRFTRNSLFPRLFLSLPAKIRSKIVQRMRWHSQTNRGKSMQQMNVVPTSLMRHLRQFNVNTVIHGHTHQPGLTNHNDKWGTYKQYILSDWDQNPLALCYNNSEYIYFDVLGE